MMSDHVLTVNNTADRAELTCETCGFAVVIYVLTGAIEPVNPGDGTYHSWTQGNITMDLKVKKDGEE